MSEGNARPVGTIQIPEVDVYWSTQRRGEIEVRILDQGNNPEQLVGKLILGKRLDAMEGRINSDIRGRAAPWEEVERTADVKNASTRNTTGKLSINASGEIETEETAVVATSRQKGTLGGEVSIEHARGSSTEQGNASVYRRDHGALDPKDIAAYRIEANVRVLSELQDWLDKNPRGGRVGDYQVEPKDVQKALDARRVEIAQDLGKAVRDGLTTTGAAVLKPLMDSQQWLKERFDGLVKPFSRTSAEPGFDAPDNPYRAMYATTLDAVRRDPALRGGATPEDMAAALTYSASQQRIDPAATLTLRASADGAVHGVVAGGIDPAASRIRVDPANLAVPTAEQVAQVQAPTPDDPARRTGMTMA